MNIRRIDFNDAILGLLIIGIAILISFHSFARSGPQWDNQPIAIRQWFQKLMQPDNKAVSCCGEADAFEADDYEIEGDHYIAIITDGKGVLPNGTRIAVPNYKMKWDEGNPTGHGILFISSAGAIYCYVTPGGV